MKGQKRCYVQLVECIMGKVLPKRAVVHHINNNRADNRPRNLVVCQDQAYHMLLHLRMRSMEATGSVNRRICKYCKLWDMSDNLTTARSAGVFWHPDCHNRIQKEVYLRRREKARAQQKLYYQQNKELILAQKKWSRQNNKAEQMVKLANTLKEWKEARC